MYAACLIGSCYLKRPKEPAMAYLTRFCKSVIDIKQQHRVLDRALVERGVNRSGGGHLYVYAESKPEMRVEESCTSNTCYTWKLRSAGVCKGAFSWILVSFGGAHRLGTCGAAPNHMPTTFRVQSQGQGHDARETLWIE